MSHLEEKLALQIRALGLPTPSREFKFHEKRKWRFDFAFPELLWAIEVHGGGWNNGGHNRNPIVMWRDYEKLNAAQELGWRVLQFTGVQVHDGTAIAQLERILSLPICGHKKQGVG